MAIHRARSLGISFLTPDYAVAFLNGIIKTSIAQIDGKSFNLLPDLDVDGGVGLGHGGGGHGHGGAFAAAPQNVPGAVSV